MNIALIGMSGVGKTYWSKKLEEEGFRRFGCDDIIEEKLGKELKKLGYAGINDVAKWMGQPYDNRYTHTSKRYLMLEQEALEEILAALNKSVYKHVVVDTTGSIIYMKNTLLQTLSRITKIVYFETPASVKKEMYEQYRQNQKPVIWGEVFGKKKGQSETDALKSCYPELLAFRTKKYEKLAHTTIGYTIIKRDEFTVETLLKHVV